MIIGIIGGGAWGCALAILCEKAGNSVVLWSFSGKTFDFSGKEIKITRDLSDLGNCDAWLIATPSDYFREIVSKSRPFYKKQPIIICTKGMELGTCMFMSEILNDALPKCLDFGVLSGPQFAAEVAAGKKTGGTLAGTARALEFGRKIFKNFYLQETSDVFGVEISGVGKNAVSLIMGYASKTADGENDRAMILTLAWAEIVAIGQKLGGRLETFLLLCGIGDLFLSATSYTGRNFSAGANIASGEKPIGTVEGIGALNGLIKIAEKLDMDARTLCLMKKQLNI